MSTNDVPGANPANRDELAMGGWAEHEDGSLILVESTEGGRVVYSIFDMEKSPITEYRDAMADGAFKKAFSWNPKDPKSEKWTWHDKTAFPWDRIIKLGGRDGARYVSAEDQLNAAERIRRSREIHRGREVDIAEIETRVDQLGERAEGIIRRLQRRISGLPKGKGKR
jgi:hypothetical protein